MFCGLVDKKLAIVDYKNVDLKKSKLFHFFKGVSPWFLVKFWKFCSFFFLKKTKKIGQKKLFCKLVDRKLPILDYINNELRKFKILHFFKGVRAWFLVKNKKLCPFFFFSKKGQKKVFCGLLYRKLAILEYKNIHLETSKILHFSKGVSPCFLVKNGKVTFFFFFSKIGQNSVFCDLVDRKQAI